MVERGSASLLASRVPARLPVCVPGTRKQSCSHKSARGDKLEAFYRRQFDGLTLAQLRTLAYAPVWDVEHNRLDFAGPRTHPDLPVARAIRTAVSLPLFIQPARPDG